MEDNQALSPEEEETLLQQALQNLGVYIIEHGQPQYVLIDDYSPWEYGTEPLPRDHTWRSTSIDVSPSSLD